MSRLRSKGSDGIAAVEMAIVLSLLMLLAFGAVPLWQMGMRYQLVSQVSAEALRYASAVTANGTRPPGGVLSRRPTAAQVAAFAQAAAGSTTVTVTTLVCPGDVSSACVAADPSSAKSGDGITVVISATVDLSVAGSIANAVGHLVGSGDIAPGGVVTLTSTAHAREE